MIVARRFAGREFLSRDYQSLSLFRIVFSVYLLGHYLLLDRHYATDLRGEMGVLPIARLVDAYPSSNSIVPALQLFEAIGVPAILPILLPLAVIAFAFGYRTRCANAIIFALNSYIDLRNPFVLSGAEVLSRLLLLWCLFLPLNRYWSLDAALDPRPRDRPHPLLPFLALRLQITSLYVFAGLFKLASPEWMNGSGLLWALQDNMVGARPLGLFLVAHVPSLLALANYLIIAFQIAFPLLIYCPWGNDRVRGLAIAATAVMHLSFIFCLTIGSFPYVCLAMLLLLVPDRWVERALGRRRARLGRITIFHDPDCVFCRKASLLLREFLLSPGSRVERASADPEAAALLARHRSWVVRGTHGELHVKSMALAYLLKQNPLVAPFARVCTWPALRGSLDRAYDFIGAYRRQLGQLSNFLLPVRRPRTPGRAAQTVCGFLVLVALSLNLLEVQPPAIGERAQPPMRFTNRPPVWLRDLATDLQVWQHWALFTPPSHARQEYRALATDADGNSFDLMARLPEPLFRLEADGRMVFADQRWFKYVDHVDIFLPADWDALGRYLCRRANTNSPPPPTVAIEFIATRTPVDDRSSDTRQHYDKIFDCWR